MTNNEKKDNFLESLNKEANESFQEEHFEKQKIDYVKWIILIVVLVAILVTGYVMLNQKVEVIDFTDMTSASIESWGVQNGISIATKESYSDAEEGLCISQNIEPETKIAKKQTILVTLSKGFDPYEKIDVPDFDQSWSRESIVNWLNQNSIENSTILFIEDDDVKEGYLISYRLIGASLEDFTRSSEIEFVVSQITEATSVEMPDFLNSTITSVDIWAQKNNVKYTYEEANSDIYQSGKIMYQSIADGERFDIANEVSFIVSEGEIEEEEFELENFIGQSYSLLDSYAKLNGLTLVRKDEKNEDYQEGKIVLMDPLPGEEISAGDKITCIVSSGIDKEYMPSLLGLNLKQLDSFLQFTDAKYRIEYRNSEIYDEDTVMGQSIDEGIEIGENTYIVIAVSLGTNEEPIVMDDFINSTIVEVDKWSKENHLSYVTRFEFDEYYSKDRVISQSVNSGSEIKEGQEFIITVSKGKKIIVPDFEDMDQDEIDMFLQENQVTIRNEYIYSKEHKVDELVSQSINPDSVIEEGVVMTLTWSLGDEVYIEDFCNREQYEFENMINSYIDQGALIEYEVITDTDSLEDKGVITYQSIKNEDVDINDIIVISVSDGITVPDFSTMTKQEVMQKQYPFNIIIEEKYENNTNENDFVSQSIIANEKVSRDDTITLVYSLGDSIVISNYERSNLVDLETFIQSVNDDGANIKLETFYEYSFDYDMSKIMAQSKKATMIGIDETIIVRVSNGESYTVPDFSTYTLERIEQIKNLFGVNVVVKEIKDPSKTSGQFISQSVEANSIIPKTDFIIVNIAE